MAGSRLSDDCEVAVVGAGPYGLAAAAHLRAAGIDLRSFGRPLSFRREHMPDGMRLRSPWIATDIADPSGAPAVGGGSESSVAGSGHKARSVTRHAFSDRCFAHAPRQRKAPPTAVSVNQSELGISAE